MHVYVFGAGASALYGAPVTSDLLAEAYSGWDLIPQQSTDFENELKTVAVAIDRKYGTHLASFADGKEPPDVPSSLVLRKISVEDLIAHAEQTEDEQLLGALHGVIFKTVEKNLNYHRDGEYEKLVKNVVGLECQTCFISFNYDLLLDRALTQHARGRWSYGIQFESGIDKNFPSYARGTNEPRIYLLKLHGSLNWYRCTGCGAARVYSFRRFQELRHDSTPCARCSGNRFRPLLIAPSPAKCSQAPVEPAWRRAADCLEQASALTVIGYSFPSVDTRVRELFLRHFIVPNLNQLDCSSRPQLTLANKDQHILDTIERFFEPATDHALRFETFEDFINSGKG